MKPVSIIRIILLYQIGCCAVLGKITNMAPTGIGFNEMSKYYEVMGPLGQTKEAFEEHEEEEKTIEEKEENDQTSGFELELQNEEEKYLDYKEQLELAKQKGQDPSKVPKSPAADNFQDVYEVDKSAKRKIRKRNEKQNRNRKELINRLQKEKKREKRFAVEDSDKYWYHGIVPFIFSKTITEEDKMSKIRAKSRFHYWTCVRFVPWTKTTSEEYGLDHDNYLVHIEKNGCWSFVGNMKMNGQKISCCRDATCLHELGHALGLHHEQKSPIHDDYLHINQDNIEPEKISGYNEVEPIESKTFGYFDMASAMLYNKYAFSNNGMPTMTVFDEKMEYLLNNPDPYLFYMFKEITTLYRCKDQMCPDFTKECTNGYVAYIGNSCTCRCPKGLDPETGCKTVYRGDKNFKSINWPSTEFSMLKPRDGCPRGFKEGNMIQYVKGTRVSPQFNFDAINGDDYFNIKFCTNDKKSPGSNNAEWESGQYCILSYDGFCPEGFFDGFIKYGKDKVKVVAWPLPDGKFNDEIVWHFCCREDGSLKDPLYLPTKEPFSLFPRDSECQQVKDMKAEKQWFMIQSSGDIFVTGSSPNVRIAKKTSVFVDICYYWPIDYNCGGIINISNDNPVVEIKSPNYPDVYNLKQECSWTIMGPENTHIKLDFEGFDVESTIQEDGFPTCGDSLEVRSMLPGHPGVNYCGPSFKPTIISEVNYIGLTLSSGLTEVRKGFKAVATLITDADMCYTDKGEDYRGTANVTTLFEPCLPWTHVQHCPHHAFNAGDLDDDLVDNYCRNPGSGTKPWCYTHYEDCSRNYCDPCRLENCYDLLVDCNMLLSKDASFCQSNVEAQRICRKSCGFCLKTKIKPVSRVSCAPPPPLEDAVSNEKLRKQYKVGDQVTFRCKNGKELEQRVCLSDGSWSGSNFVCGRCPNGWIPFKEKCYRWFDSYENWTASVNICNGYSSIIASAKDSDEFNFLLKLRQDVRSFWIGIQYDQNVRDNIWLEDGTPVSFNNFKSGSRMGCAYVDKNGDWRGTPCDSVEFFGFICKLSPSARTVCSDARDDCEEFLREEPGACEGYPDFAWHICPKSCYRCKSEIDVKCPMPVLAANSEMVKTKSVLYPGTMIEYRCKKGFILQSGDLRRTCLLSGKLTGDNPVCLGEKFVSTPNNRVELRQRTQDGSDGVAYTADNDAMRIHKTGKLVRWQFYSVYDGEVAFQVWRKTIKADRYKLVGQNIIEHTGNHRTRTIEVIPSGQIDVVAGDMIGFYLPKENKGGITFDKCVAENTFGDFGNQKVFVDKIKTSLDWIAGNSYDAENDKSKCKIFSLRGYVL